MHRALEEGRLALHRLRSPETAPTSLEKALADFGNEFRPDGARFQVFVVGRPKALRQTIQEQIYLSGGKQSPIHSTTPRRQVSRLRLCICLASWVWSSATMAAALIRKRYGCSGICTGVFWECTSTPETLERTSIYGAGVGQELKWKSLFRAISQPRLALALRSDHPSARVACYTTVRGRTAARMIDWHVHESGGNRNN